jgi:hypothetical protein
MTRAFCERELARHRSGWRRPVSNLRQRQILAVAASPDFRLALAQPDDSGEHNSSAMGTRASPGATALATV